MEEAIELRKLFKAIRKRIVFIAAVVLTFTLIGWPGSGFVLSTKYQASTDILVNGPVSSSTQGGITATDITSNLLLMDTYSTVIMSPRILDSVSAKVGIPLKTLQKQISVNAVKGSQVLSIVTTDSNPGLAVEIANQIATVFQSEIPKIMDVNNVTILTPARETSRVWPRPLLLGALGFAVGLVAAIGTVIIRDSLDTRFRSKKDVERILQIPVLGTIPGIRKVKSGTIADVHLTKHLSVGGKEA